MTLDVPTGGVITKRGSYRFATTEDCLKQTLEYLNFFERMRTPGKIRFLNVLQGNDLGETDMWYEAVKHYSFEGWAFAGILRHDMYALVRRVLIMADQGMLKRGERDWIHVLGTCELDVAVMLTALQRAINRHINPNLRISFDTSTPCRMLSVDMVYTLPKFAAASMSMGETRAPDGQAFIGQSISWPWPSAIGNRIVMGDFCVPKRAGYRRFRDTLSDVSQVHHNLSALCFGINLANRVFDAEGLTGLHTVGNAAGAAVEAIEKVIKANTMTALAQQRQTFAGLRHSFAVNQGDDDRT